MVVFDTFIQFYHYSGGGAVKICQASHSTRAANTQGLFDTIIEEGRKKGRKRGGRKDQTLVNDLLVILEGHRFQGLTCYPTSY